jgi:hypothetical protein
MNQTLEPGEYFVGDPSFVLPSDVYTNFWGILNNFQNDNYSQRGFNFVVHNTHGGDGIFKDSVDREYIVESGFLGMTDTQLIHDYESSKKGHFYLFEKPVNFIYDAGIFNIKSGKKYITIDTRNLEEYCSDIEEHCEDFKLTASDTDSIDEITKCSEDNDEEEREEDERSHQLSFFRT